MKGKLVQQKFVEIFNQNPFLLIRSPGRINLIGEHTDYNRGLVLPAAIDKAIFFAISFSKSKAHRIYALNRDEFFKCRPGEFHRSKKSWPNYFLGVLQELNMRGCAVPPFNCVFGGDIPIGSGLSSSAALTCGFAFALKELLNLDFSRRELAQIAQNTEHHFVGVQCGIMDQFANLFGKKDHVLKLDCDSQRFEYIPFNFPEVSWLLLDTQISHDLAASEYNLRRQQCEAAVIEIRKRFSQVRSLREVSIEMLNEIKQWLNPVLFKRCTFVIKEIKRIEKGCTLLKAGQLQKFGELMFETHKGLQREYEVSCAPLDYLVEVAQKHPAVLGARLMGGGFGGCTLNLIISSYLDEFVADITLAYKSRFGMKLKVYPVKIEDGTSVLS